MNINNQNKSTKIKYTYMIVVFLYLVSLVTSLFVGLFNNYYFELGLTIVTITILSTMLYLQYNYIFFSDDGNIIILRYYSLNPLFSEPKSIEIPKNIFSKFQIETSFFEKKKNITLFVKTRNGIAKYPSVSISSLNRTEIEKIIKTLEKYI